MKIDQTKGTHHSLCHKLSVALNLSLYLKPGLLLFRTIIRDFDDRSGRSRVKGKIIANKPHNSLLDMKKKVEGLVTK